MSSMSPDLNVTVDANVQPYEKGIERARQATFRYETAIRSVEADILALEKAIDDHATAALHRQHDAMDKTGKAVFIFGAAVATGLGLAVNEAIQWESAWAGVTKTVDGSAPQMAALEEQLRGLTLILPATHEEIAAVAAAAGQLGVAREDIAGFTRTAIDLGETTDLAAEQAATSLAQLMNIMRTAPADVDRLGSTLVELGNSGASTESQILATALRVAGAGQMVGATESDVLALSSAMADLGIQSELGGGAIQRTFITINSAVAEGGEQLGAFAELAGMTSDRFAEAWANDPVAAFDALIQGMGRVQAGGGDLASVLASLEITGTQNLQVLLRMAGAGDLLTESLARASGEWAESNALLEEAAERYETTEGQIELARNQLRDAAIDIGGTLVPAVAAVVGTGADLIQFWRDLPGPVKSATTVLATAAAAVALFSGATLIAIPRIAAFNAALAGLEAGALKTAGTRLAAMGSMLAGPWGIALLAGITAVGIFGAKQGAAARQIDAVKATLDDQTGMLTANSRAWAVNFLADEGMLVRAKELGVELGLVTDAALGNADALSTLAAMQGELEASLEAASEASDGDTQAKLEATQADSQRLQSLTRLIKVLTDTNGVVADARQEWELEREAMGEASDASDRAAGAQKGLTGAWQGGADAAGELGEEVKTLGEDLDELSGAYLDNRSAGRAIRDQLREIRRATAEYRDEHGSLVGAFARGTESGDGFASMLDSLAQDYQKQITATENLNGSQAAVMGTYRRSRAALMEVAQQLGMTREQAARYVEEVLGTPAMVRTRFEAENLQKNTTDTRAYRDAINSIPQTISTIFFRKTVETTTKQPLNEQENGGIVTAYAEGGFSFGGRRSVAREPMIARGGANILWAEPSTGWEAYISGKPGMENRNRDVWAEAGRRLGLTANGGTQVVERTVVVKQMLPDRLTLDVDGRAMTAYVRGHARDVTGLEIDRREAGRGLRGRMSGWGET